MRLGLQVLGLIQAGQSGTPYVPTPTIAAPSITSPADDAVDTGTSLTVTASAFVVTNEGSDTHASSDWQVASDAGFTTIVDESLADATNKTSYGVSGLDPLTEYFVRVRYHGTTYGASPWSGVISFTTADVAADLIASLAVGYWDAANLASQTESDASIPEVGDEVYTVADVSVAGDWGEMVRVSASAPAPTLRADGTSYYWEVDLGEAFLGSRAGAALTADVFMVVRLISEPTAASMLFYSPSTNKFVGYSRSGDAGLPYAVTSGTPVTYVNGVSKATRGALSSALLGTGWKLLRVSNVDMSTFVGPQLPRPVCDADISLCAVIPSATVATGTNLTDIVTQLEARIAELNA